MTPKVILVARTATIGDLVTQCAEGKLPFDTLCARVAAMGFSTRSLYEMVRGAERERVSP